MTISGPDEVTTERAGAVRSTDDLSPPARPGPSERAVFVAGVVATVAYLVLAYLVFVRPGVDRADHVLAVLLPAAILALCGELYPRLSAGLRASLALLFGVIGVVTGVTHVGQLSVEGLSGLALSGLLPLFAGVIFLGIGTCVAWTSRKRAGPWRRTVARRTVVVVVALFVVYWVVIPVSKAIIATEQPREPLAAFDLGVPYEKVSLITRDGLRLSAWYVPSRNKAAIITYPRAATVSHARMLVQHGYGVLLVDPRGEGESQGDPNAYGWGSARDIDAATVWLRGRAEVKKRGIGGLGLSTGGAAMVESASRNRRLKVVVSEGAGICSVRESLLRRGPSALEKALQYPQDLMQTVAVWVLSGDDIPMSLENASVLVGPRAVFFIYGEDGEEIERAVNPVYYDAALPPKEIWMVPGAGHAGGIQAEPQKYEEAVVGLFDRVLLGKD